MWDTNFNARNECKGQQPEELLKAKEKRLKSQCSGGNSHGHHTTKEKGQEEDPALLPKRENKHSEGDGKKGDMKTGPIRQENPNKLVITVMLKVNPMILNKFKQI